MSLGTQRNDRVRSWRDLCKVERGAQQVVQLQVMLRRACRNAGCDRSWIASRPAAAHAPSGTRM
eukprot:4636262-Pleurochrysis_carterae.AAC.1